MAIFAVAVSNPVGRAARHGGDTYGTLDVTNKEPGQSYGWVSATTPIAAVQASVSSIINVSLGSVNLNQTYASPAFKETMGSPPYTPPTRDNPASPPNPDAMASATIALDDT